MGLPYVCDFGLHKPTQCPPGVDVRQILRSTNGKDQWNDGHVVSGLRLRKGMQKKRRSTHRQATFSTASWCLVQGRLTMAPTSQTPTNQTQKVFVMACRNCLMRSVPR